MSKGNPEQMIEKIEKLESSTSGSNVFDNYMQEQETRVPPNKERFDALMTQQAEQVGPTRKVESTGKVTLAEEVASLNKQVDRLKGAPKSQLIAKVEEAQGKMRELQHAINDPAFKEKTTVDGETKLMHQLTHMDESLKITLNKAGLEYKSPLMPVEQVTKNPIERFLGFLENGQKDLDTLGGEVFNFQRNGHAISPADMIAVQYKVNTVQQQVELFTATLNKSLETIKSIMNTQV